MTMLRIFVSYAPTDASFATQLMTDLREAGAEVIKDRTDLDDIAFEELLSKELPLRQHLIMVQTPEALQSPRVRVAVDTALRQMQAGQMRDVLRVIAPTVNGVGTGAVPLRWSKMPEFDASQDYPRALARLCLHLGTDPNDTQNVPPPPVYSTPPLGPSEPKGIRNKSPIPSLSFAQSSNRMDHPSRPHRYPPDPKENKFPVAAPFHTQRSTTEDRPLRPLRHPHTQLHRRLFFFALAMIVVPVIIGVIVLKSTPTRTLISTSSVITITPDSQTIHQGYDITANSSPDFTQYQASAHSITTTVPGVSQTVKATGTKTLLGTTATGELTFYVFFGQGNDYPAGTTFTGNDGVVVAIDKDVSIPSQTTVTVPAHAVDPGVSGNIAAQDIHVSNVSFLSCPASTGTQLAASSAAPNPDTVPLSQPNTSSPLLPPIGNGTYVICNLSPFTGGKDASTQTSVQQSDIDITATNIEQTAPTPDPRSALQTQFNTNEDFAESPQCQPQVSSDHNAGDAADHVTVTINYTCSGVVYNKQEAQTMAQKQLTAKAKNDFGDGYTLSGNTTSTITHSIITNISQETVVVGVNVTGTWIFQISDAQKRNWVSAIAGKKKSDAQSYLQNQKGIKQVNLSIHGGGDTLPSDTTKITLTVTITNEAFSTSVPQVQLL